MTRRGAVSIGAAAALYGLAPSTVRWWERQGVLDPPAREGGKRRYGDTDLRRIGLAYLCCVVGRMPLDQAAVVTSGKATRGAWQDAIEAQLVQVERQMAELEAARRYLRHALSCTDDDIAGCCPVLDAELTAHTPRGRAPAGDLVTAARTARPPRDETPAPTPPRDETLCPSCRDPLPSTPRGRPRTYCSAACRQRAYRARRGGRAR
ncbi:MerR family transcriptional regulator [Streptomyces spectabilis]|uniref:MerR family transcriptional regulator n=1 Tax=Streptomyces spectabilis TaxID=68270 RepID=A0A516REY1_STRST|nr:MerR family transcriptional regulator [Streptomyces spectabilis]QDQ14217.1 MerR family transcriptional regulator [Streptomyces spectabilis]